MARNLQLNILRGVFANMPTLGPGELYLATDRQQLFVGVPSVGDVGIGLPVYSIAGALQLGQKVVRGSVVIGGGGTATVALIGTAIFASATSFTTVASDVSAKNRSPQIAQNSGSSITFTANAGDTINFVCIGQ